jgi:hypothetical protein
MALSTIGGKFKGVISKDQDLLDAAKHGNVEAIGKLTAVAGCGGKYCFCK